MNNNQNQLRLNFSPFKEYTDIPTSTVRLLFSSSQDKRQLAIKDLELFFKENIDCNNEDSLNYFIKNYKALCYDKIDHQSIISKRSSLAGLIQILNLIIKNNDIKPSSFILIVEFLISMLKESYTDYKLAFEITSNLDRLLKSKIELVLECFNEIFAVVIYLYSNCSSELINFVINLDDILKDLLSQAYKQGYMNDFKIESFFNVVENGLSVVSSNTKNIIVNWIQFIDLKINKKVIYEFDRLVPGIFPMLNDTNKEVIFSAEQLLNNLSNEFEKSFEKLDERIKNNILSSIIKQALDPGDRSKQIGLDWILMHLEKSKSILKFKSENNLEIQKGDAPFSLFGSIINLILINVKSEIEAISEKSLKCNNILLEIFMEYSCNNFYDFSLFETVLKEHFIFNKNEELSLEIALTWTQKITSKFKTDILDKIDMYLELTGIHNESVFMNIIDLICEIMTYKDEYKLIVMTKLFEKMSEMTPYFTSKTQLIIKKISIALNVKTSFLIISEVLMNMKINNTIKDKDFLTHMITSLDVYLLLSPEAESFRDELKSNQTEEKSESSFKKIFPTWCFNPVSAIILSFISLNFELCFNLLLKFSSFKQEQDYYIQLTQLVQLVESSIMNNIRILLLNPIKNIYLIKTLYGILMILPQGKAFTALSKRLKNIETLMIMESKFIKEEDLKISQKHCLEIEFYLKEFDRIQAIKKK